MAYFESNSVYSQLKNAYEVLTSSDIFNEAFSNENLREIELFSQEGQEISNKKPPILVNVIGCDLCEINFGRIETMYRHKHNIHKVDRFNVKIPDSLWEKK